MLSGQCSIRVSTKWMFRLPMLMTSPVLTTSMGQPVVSNWASMKRLPMVDVMIFSGLQRSTELTQGPGVVFFGVVHDDVVDLVERYQLGEAAEHGSGVIVVHRVERRSSRRGRDSCYGSAARGTAVAVEVALVVVDGPDPENIFRQFNGFHSDKILSGMFEVSTKTWGCDEARHTPILRVQTSRYLRQRKSPTWKRAADGTDPIFGQIFKSGAGGDAAVRSPAAGSYS